LGPPPPAPAWEPNFRSRQTRLWTAPKEIWSSHSYERRAWRGPRTGVTGQRHKAIILRLQQHDHSHNAHSAPRVLDLQERACVSLGAERVRELSSCQLVAHARGAKSRVQPNLCPEVSILSSPCSDMLLLGTVEGMRTRRSRPLSRRARENTPRTAHKAQASSGRIRQALHFGVVSRRMTGMAAGCALQRDWASRKRGGATRRTQTRRRCRQLERSVSPLQPACPQSRGGTTSHGPLPSCLARPSRQPACTNQPVHQA
jgi:hypothetical protein